MSKDISIRIESHPLDINTYPGPTGPVTSPFLTQYDYLRHIRTSTTTLDIYERHRRTVPLFLSSLKCPTSRTLADTPELELGGLSECDVRARVVGATTTGKHCGAKKDAWTTRSDAMTEKQWA